MPAMPEARPFPLPWNDRRGRFSRLKASVFALAFVPGIVLIGQYLAGALPGRPVMELVHGAGFWTVRFLLISLAITPMRRMADWPEIVLVRRMVGLTALAYVIAHLLLYVVDENFRLGTVASEIVLRVYLTIGFVALLGLALLGATSTDGWIRRMGRNWKQLHRIVYLLAALGVLHFFMQAKANVSEAVMMAGFLLWLLLWRVMPARFQASVPALLLMAPVVAVGTALIEYGWYAVATRINPMRVLAANWNWHAAMNVGPRPAVWVLVVAVLVALIPLYRVAFPRKRAVAGRRAARTAGVMAGMAAASDAGAVGAAGGLERS
jgi:methionine sulfoxide reductase heme-binding subunit